MKKEIIEMAKHCAYGGNCFKCCKNDAYHSCVAMFSKAITEHDERYRWHDLRNNPDALPQISDEDYLIAEEWIDGDRTYTIGNREYIWYHSTHNKLPFKVIGWCEINLFESEG